MPERTPLRDHIASTIESYWRDHYAEIGAPFGDEIIMRHLYVFAEATKLDILGIGPRFDRLLGRWLWRSYRWAVNRRGGNCPNYVVLSRCHE